ncbi:hypothetical protein [Tropicimonas marinistellae]|uniref:hypothetical protein n=1 Tax=Tropicimonas marinistellae TaxID=1739787 RepID=UPI0008322F00|nr:hypothetical protein [Tropicimonas marinistellae]
MTKRDRSINVWSRAVGLVLICALIAPMAFQLARPHVSDHQVVAQYEMPHDASHHHPEPNEGDLAGHCHPGIDCHFQAIVEILTIPRPVAEQGRQHFLARGRTEPGIEHGFDPPPPRVAS